MNEALSFLIQCFFGEISDPYLAAIDKAYFDMQTHTITGAKNAIFEMRWMETEYLYDRLKNIRDKNNYDEWHRETSREMKEMNTSIKLTYGQIQKWINMSVKYLYTLKRLGIDKIDDYFIEYKNDFHAPLDSYVLSAIGEKVSWSKIEDYDEYKEISHKISFEDEYRKWSEYAKNARMNKDGLEKKSDKGSYKRFIQDNFSDKGKEYCGKIRWQTKAKMT